MATNNAINANSTTPLPIVDGGTGVTSVTTSPTATAFSGWDANKNLSANNHIESYTTTATAAGTTVLTVSSTYQQFFTGSTTQTVTLPVTSTLVLGQSFLVVNNSSGVVTVQSSGANTVTAMAASTVAIFTCILTSGTSAASWNSDYSLNTVGVSSITGTANQVIASASTGAVTLSTPQSIATSSAVQFASVSFSSTSGIIGTTTNNNAAAGSVGEFVDSGVVSGTITTTVTSQNLTSISLTAGDWDVYASAEFVPAAASNTQFIAGINTTSVTLPTTGSTAYWQRSDLSLNVDTGFLFRRVSIGSTTTVYLVGQANFPTTSPSFNCQLSARRNR